MLGSNYFSNDLLASRNSFRKDLLLQSTNGSVAEIELLFFHADSSTATTKLQDSTISLGEFFAGGTLAVFIGFELANGTPDTLAERLFVPPQCLLLFFCKVDSPVDGLSNDPARCWILLEMDSTKTR